MDVAKLGPDVWGLIIFRLLFVDAVHLISTCKWLRYHFIKSHDAQRWRKRWDLYKAACCSDCARTAPTLTNSRADDTTLIPNTPADINSRADTSLVATTHLQPCSKCQAARDIIADNNLVVAACYGDLSIVRTFTRTAAAIGWAIYNAVYNDCPEHIVEYLRTVPRKLSPVPEWKLTVDTIVVCAIDARTSDNSNTRMLCDESTLWVLCMIMYYDGSVNTYWMSRIPSTWCVRALKIAAARGNLFSLRFAGSSSIMASQHILEAAAANGQTDVIHWILSVNTFYVGNMRRIYYHAVAGGHYDALATLYRYAHDPWKPSPHELFALCATAATQGHARIVCWLNEKFNIQHISRLKRIAVRHKHWNVYNILVNIQRERHSWWKDR